MRPVDIALLRAWFETTQASADAAFALEIDGVPAFDGRPWGDPPLLISAEVDAAAVRLTQAWRGQRSLLEIRGLEAVHADARPHAAAAIRLDGALVLRRQRLDATRRWFGGGGSWDWHAKARRAWLLRR